MVEMNKPYRNPFNITSGQYVIWGDKIYVVDSVMPNDNCFMLRDIDGNRFKQPVPISHVLPATETAALLFKKN